MRTTGQCQEVHLRLARRVHGSVIPPLQAVGMVLSGDGDLSRAERRECASVVTAALGELRSTLLPEDKAVASGGARPVAAIVAEARATHPELSVELSGEGELVVPGELESLIGHFVGEAIGNAAHHARPSTVTVRVERHPSALRIEVDNDGAGPRRRHDGIGLRLVAEHALLHDALLEWQRPAPSRWRTRLVVPLREADR